MKQSLAWLWLIGAVLYAVSVWLPADTVYVAREKRPTPASSSPSIATSIPLTAPAQVEQTIDARTNSIPGTASQQVRKAEAASEVSTAAPAERLVVRSSARIRSGPSSKSSPIGTAPRGAELEVAEREAGWVRFVDPATSHTGWIYEGLLAPWERTRFHLCCRIQPQ